MERNKFINIRFRDPLIKERVLEKRNRIVGACRNCSGSGFAPVRNSRVSYCRCMREFQDVKDILVSGAPLEALEVLAKLKGRSRLTDVEYKRVQLSVDRHDIMDISHKRMLYRDLLRPYVSNAETAIANGDSLLLFGTNSRGKTWALYFILVTLMKRYSILFLNLKDLFVIINTALYGADNSREAASTKGEARALMSLVRDVDVLLLDEGSKLPKFSANVAVQLEGIVKDRIGNRRSVVMATNHAPGEFYAHFGPQVVSAFIKNVYPAHILTGVDLRRKAMGKSSSFSYLVRQR